MKLTVRQEYWEKNVYVVGNSEIPV